MIMASTHNARKRSSGTVLITAMLIVLVLAGLVLVFGRAMRVEAIASANYVAGLQAEAVAQGALQFVISEVDGTNGTYAPGDDASFEAVAVGGGFFWILNPSTEDTVYCFGIREEASRLSVNSAAYEMLLNLPAMTSELAASIIDWRDPDSEVSPGGAESEYYLLLADPYYCKNAPFESIEELLLVKDASRALLIGEDANRNGVLDANENDAANSDPPDNHDGRLDRGLFSFVTVYSSEANTDASGNARVNVNDRSSSALSQLLQNALPPSKFLQVMDRVRSGRPFSNILDFHFKTGLAAAEFAAIADRITTADQRVLTGLVNVNTAPREVLLCLPGLEESNVDALLAKRRSAGADLANLAWVAEVLPREKAEAVGGMITTRAFQFSADIIAVSGDGRAFRRYWTVIDTRSSPPRVLVWKDLTHLGWPLDLEVLADLRKGKPPVASTTRS